MLLSFWTPDLLNKTERLKSAVTPSHTCTRAFKVARNELVAEDAMLFPKVTFGVV